MLATLPKNSIVLPAPIPPGGNGGIARVNGEVFAHIGRELQQQQAPVAAAALAPRFELRYLSTDQFKLGGSNACTFAAAYWALYLLASPAVKETTLCRYLHQACSEWLVLRPTAEMRAMTDLVQDVYKLAPNLKDYMTISSEHQGLMITNAVYQQMQHKLLQFSTGSYGAYTLAIAPIFSQLANEVMADPRGLGRSFVFTRGNRTMSGRFRKDKRTGGMQIDMTDSHRNYFPNVPSVNQPPPDTRASATWMRCTNLSDAVDWMHRLFPPSDDIKEIKSFFETCNKMTLLQTLQEEKLPSAFFSIVVFKLDEKQTMKQTPGVYQ